jgi:transcriptional regulator with XRE-family HTH domain
MTKKKNPHKKLGNRIRQVMGLTNELQKTIAKKAGVQPTEISRWQRGEVAPSYNKLVAIGRALKLNGDELSWLFDGKGKAPDYPGYKQVVEEEESIEEVEVEKSVEEVISKKPKEGDEMYRFKFEEAQEKIAMLQNKLINALEYNAEIEKELLKKAMPSTKRKPKANNGS